MRYAFGSSSGDRRQLLSNGLSVYGASRTRGRRESFVVDEYFQSGFSLVPGATVLDVGANIGLFSLEVLRRLDGKARIFAFEPAPTPFGFLERNLRELFPGAAVSCQCCAIGERAGRSKLYYRPRAPLMSSLLHEPSTHSNEFIDAILKEPPAGRRTRSVRMRRVVRPVAPWLLKLMSWWMMRVAVEVPCEITTISAIIHEQAIDRIDLLKIDVEGSELAVLRGIAADDWPKISAIMAEVHDVDGRVQKIREILEAQGFGLIRFSQEWPFEGTHIYMLEAGREADGTPRPAI